MIRSAAAQIRLGNQRADFAAELRPELIQFPAIRRQVAWLAAQADIAAFGHWKADEAYARIAVVIGFAASDGASQALLTVKAVARGQDHGPVAVAGQGSPERLLNGF